MENNPTIPKGWFITTLGSVAEWGSGGTPPRKNPEFFNGNIPWIKTGELGDKYIRLSEEFLSEEAVNESSARIFQKGAVGIAMYGATIGKVSIWGINASTNQACAVAQCFSEVINNEFLYYFLLSEKQRFITAGKGGAQPNISQGILKDWPILLPPLNEQLRIVAKIEELLSELDKGIESLKTAHEQLKVYRQAVLKHAFEGKLTAKWREQNNVTESWDTSKLGKCGAWRGGGTPSKSVSSYWDNGHVLWVSPKDAYSTDSCHPVHGKVATQST